MADVVLVVLPGPEPDPVVREPTPREAAAVVVDAIENGDLDDYLEALLRAAHDRKRTRRGVRNTLDDEPRGSRTDYVTPGGRE